jgi:transcriptional regulator with XRE-family HTH domain
MAFIGFPIGGFGSMKANANDIGQNLVKLRLQRGMTQEQLAARLQVRGSDMTRQVVANIEARRRRVYEHQIRRLVAVLGCSFNELFLGVPSPTNHKTPTHPKSSRR